MVSHCWASIWSGESCILLVRLPAYTHGTLALLLAVHEHHSCQHMFGSNICWLLSGVGPKDIALIQLCYELPEHTQVHSTAVQRNGTGRLQPRSINVQHQPHQPSPLAPRKQKRQQTTFQQQVESVCARKSHCLLLHVSKCGAYSAVTRYVALPVSQQMPDTFRSLWSAVPLPPVDCCTMSTATTCYSLSRNMLDIVGPGCTCARSTGSQQAVFLVHGTL